MAKHFSKNQSFIALHLKEKKNKQTDRQAWKQTTEQSSRKSHHFLYNQKRDWEQMLRLFSAYCGFLDLCFLSVGKEGGAFSLSKTRISVTSTNCSYMWKWHFCRCEFTMATIGFSPCLPLASADAALLSCADTDAGSSVILLPLSTPHLYEQWISELPQA